MRRGTTPTNTFRTNIDLTGADVYVTYAQNGQTVVEKTGDDVSVSEDRLEVRLSQEDTLAFKSVLHEAAIQIRYVFPDGTAGASNIMKASVGEILKEGVIAYGE